MQYTAEDIKNALGNDFSQEAYNRDRYTIETHTSASRKVVLGWKPIGQIFDFTTNQDGTPIIMEKPDAV